MQNTGTMAHTLSHEALLAQLTAQLSSRESLQCMCHMRLRGEPLPKEGAIERIALLGRRLIFPGFFGESAITEQNLPHRVGLALEELHTLLTDQIIAGLCFRDSSATPLHKQHEEAEEITFRFMQALPEMRRILATDVRATYLGDPAAISTDEVVFCYPGIRATALHRMANCLHRMGVPVIPRMISELAHRETGIDIHPAATIGESFTIDHGTGVVIGATSVIGNRVKIYQGVTLGARSFPTDQDNNPVKLIPRHPIIEDDVVIYSNASILGRITVGRGAVIGANVWVTKDVEPGTKITQ